jgi:hypothetical protein
MSLKVSISIAKIAAYHEVSYTDLLLVMDSNVWRYGGQNLSH